MALTGNISRKMVPGGRAIEIEPKVGAAVTIYQGSAVMADDGYMVPANSSPANLMAGGWVAETEADNSGGGAGAMTVKAVTNVFAVFTNSTGHPLVATDAGKMIRMEDDDVVTRYGNGPIQGIFLGFYGGDVTLCIVFCMGMRGQINRHELDSDLIGIGLNLTSAGKIQAAASALQAHAVQALGAGDAMSIAPTDRVVYLKSDGGAVAYATALPAGVDGQIVTFMGDSDTDVLTVPTGLDLVLEGGVSAEFKKYVNLTAVYKDADAAWVEIGRSANHS